MFFSVIFSGNSEREPFDHITILTLSFIDLKAVLSWTDRVSSFDFLKKSLSCKGFFATGTTFFQRPQHLWAISTNDECLKLVGLEDLVMRPVIVNLYYLMLESEIREK